MQTPLVQIHAVQVRDLQLAAGTWLDLLGEFGDALVVEVQAGNRIVGSRMLRLFHDGDGLLVLVEFDHAVAFRIVHVIAEHRRTPAVLGLADRTSQRGAQPVAVEDVVAQHQRARLAVDELLAQ